MNRQNWFVVGLLALAGPCAARAAAQACSELPNPLYMQVGDTQEPLMKQLGRALRDSDPPITIVYVTSGSCTNVEALYTDVPITTNARHVPSTSEDPEWTAKAPSLSCTVPQAGVAVDVANSALFVSSCNPDPPPKGIALFRGPVQGYGFIVPEASTQRAITAEEAYFTFGFGNQGMVTPWNDEAFMFIRPITKSTLLTLAATIRVPADRFLGQRLDKSSEVLSGVVSASDPEKAIGLLGVELYDKSREQVNLLAFRAFDQRYAYFPDSTSTSFDKRNVRDGHYVPWSPTVWLTKVDDSGSAVNARAGYVIDLILGKDVTPPPNFDALDIVVDVGLVPDCAMQVTRSFEGGDLSAYRPEQPCGCYYEANVSKQTPAGCVACDTENPCESGACRHGFCEAK